MMSRIRPGQVSARKAAPASALAKRRSRLAQSLRGSGPHKRLWIDEIVIERSQLLPIKDLTTSCFEMASKLLIR